jgi:5-methylcytosine-specific restriction endonuclease McrA
MSDWAYYRKEHPFCEVCGCMASETHHIVARGRKGHVDNRPANLIALCTQHHAEAHSLGRVKFPARYGLTERWEVARES